MAGNKGPDIEPVVKEESRVQALTLVVAYCEFIGATNIKARLDGFTPPDVIPGMLEAQRPDLVFTQPNLMKTGMIVEVVLDPRNLSKSRATLFNSAAQTYHADLGFVISKDVVDGEASLRYRLNALGITPQKVWVI